MPMPLTIQHKHKVQLSLMSLLSFSSSTESYYKKKHEVPSSPATTTAGAINTSPPLPPGARAYDDYEKMASRSLEQQHYQQQQQRYLNSFPQTQVLQSGPGVLPPPQTLANLSTPGSGATWHAGYVSREGRDYSHRGGGPGRGGPPPAHAARGPPSHAASSAASTSVPIAPTLSSPIDLRPAAGNSPVPPPFNGAQQPILVTPNGSQPRPSQRQFGRNLPTGTLMNGSDVKSALLSPSSPLSSL
jgi:hypothetical protein